MKTFRIRLTALAFGGCVLASAAQAESVLYAFWNNPVGSCNSQGTCLPDGGYPFGNLIAVSGELYGTTMNGGAHAEGTVYALNKQGGEKILYAFDPFTTDGYEPRSGLVNIAGTLYGTTENGGTFGHGTVFSVTTAGVEKVLYSFGAVANDGNSPYALIDLGGTLYGTTVYGGSTVCPGGCGTVFSITTAGVEKTVYAFGAAANDGAQPFGSLLNVHGMIYGITTNGGAHGEGTVYAVTTAGTEKVEYAFCAKPSCTDGSLPIGGLVDVGGTLYGTTEGGGAYRAGTVFALKGKNETAIYSFGGVANDARQPYGGVGLANVNGTLYGTTQNGGAYNMGAIYAVTTAGVENVLYSFGNVPHEGNSPQGLVNIAGTLYGTNAYGGYLSCSLGCGTVFSLTP